jgi:hypothetical protein
MSKLTSALMLVVLLVVIGITAVAQAPTGIITGTITDESGAVIPNATITITNKATGFSRTVSPNEQGLFGAPALPAGEYQVKAEVAGFRTLLREASVETGNTTTVNLPMQLGGNKDIVTVEAASAQVNYETHNIQGVIVRNTIQELPLNGRSFMQLAALEPGVTVSAGTTAQFNTLFTVSVLGSGNHTVYTVDGGNISDNIDTSGGISSMNFSQETVQEFQLSSANFDLATPIAGGGAINIVTRSGSNDFHGSGYFFFRDHNMAAYPNLARDPKVPDPFFARRNPGVWIGGPIKKDKLFFFFNYENTNQVQSVSIASTTPSFQPLTGTYGSPYTARVFSGKIDYRLNAKNSMFVRYSHDGNEGFAQSLEFGDPSNWPHNRNWADQSIMGITTVFTPALVNDLRFQYNYWNNHNDPSRPGDCALPCEAGVLPNIFIFVGSNYPAIGPNFNSPQARNTRRFELVETLSWQKGSHRLKFGGDLNPTKSAGLWGFCTPMCLGAFSPEFVRANVGAATPFLFPTLPTTLTKASDVLNLPLFAYPSSIFSGVGVGSVPLPGAYNYDENKHYDQFRAFFQDTWRIRPNFTVNYGVAWNAQTGFYNSSIPKPAYLAPIVGSGDGLLGTKNNLHEFQPALGFAWSPGKNQKTVIRGGAGIYWDGTPGYYKLREAASISPPGAARNTLAASAFSNIYPGILDLSLGGAPIPVGASLPLQHLTTMTIGQFVNLVNQELPAIQAKLAPTNPQRTGPITVSGIDIAKQGVELYPREFPLPRSYQMSIGIQREIPWDMVVQADYVRRLGINVSLGERDLNLYNRFVGGVRTPVIRPCTPAENFVPGIECSTGNITFWTDQGRSVYDALLVKVQKRFTKRFFFTASYAFQNLKGVSNVYDEANWLGGYGEQLAHHNLNVAGQVRLPWGFELSLNSSYITRTPQTALVNGLVLPGTIPTGSSEPLPGIGVGTLNAGVGKSELAAAITAYNNSAPASAQVAVPTHYQLGDPTISQDFRLTKKFSFKERYTFSVFAEMFNTLNIANLTGYSYTLDAKGSASTFFGQPTQRAGQSLGQGGPRAVQVGGRFTF